MKVWLVCFILLFGATEALQWIRQFSLPLPVFVLGGAFLAIASNYDKLTHLPFHLNYKQPNVLQEETSVEPVAPAQQPVSQSVSKLQSDRATEQPISFTIRKPHQAER